LLDAWIAARRISVVSVGHTLAPIAADAFTRHGKGRHPAGLNFGDCCAYAPVRSLNVPLLVEGDDFSRTDVPSAA
jgi:ribonuclease VapC